jgi:hypothetical protein
VVAVRLPSRFVSSQLQPPCSLLPVTRRARQTKRKPETEGPHSCKAEEARELRTRESAQLRASRHWCSGGVLKDTRSPSQWKPCLAQPIQQPTIITGMNAACHMVQRNCSRSVAFADLMKRSAMDIILKLFNRHFALPDHPPGAHYYMFVKLHNPDRHVLTDSALYGCVVSRCTCRHLQAIVVSFNGNAFEQCVPAAMAAPLSSRVFVRLPRCNTSPRKETTRTDVPPRGHVQFVRHMHPRRYTMVNVAMRMGFPSTRG